MRNIFSFFSIEWTKLHWEHNEYILIYIHNSVITLFLKPNNFHRQSRVVRATYDVYRLNVSTTWKSYLSPESNGNRKQTGFYEKTTFFRKNRASTRRFSIFYDLRLLLIIHNITHLMKLINSEIKKKLSSFQISLSQSLLKLIIFSLFSDFRRFRALKNILSAVVSCRLA